MNPGAGGAAGVMSWGPADLSNKYGLGLVNQPVSRDASALPAIAGPSVDAHPTGSPLSPDSPLFFFGVLAALTFGLMAFSTTVRVGHTTAGVNVGSTKK